MKTITPEELKARLDKGEKINLVDVREDYEHADYNIGGTHIPLGKIQSMQLDDLEDMKNDEIIFYCRSGNRSGQAALMLDQLGYKNTVNLAGGMNEWKSKVDKG